MGRAPANSRRPTRPRRSSARAAWRAFDQPASSIGKRTLSSADRHASSRGSWNTSPTLGSGPVTGSPSMVTTPASGGIRPPRTRRSVLLPQPFGPMSATTSRGRMARSMSSRTCVVRAPRNVSETPARLMPAGSTGGRARASGGVPVAGPSCVAIDHLRTCMERHGAGGARTRTREGRDGPGLLSSGLYRRLRRTRRTSSSDLLRAADLLPLRRSWARPASRDPSTVGNRTPPRRFYRGNLPLPPGRVRREQPAPPPPMSPSRAAPRPVPARGPVPPPWLAPTTGIRHDIVGRAGFERPLPRRRPRRQPRSTTRPERRVRSGRSGRLVVVALAAGPAPAAALWPSSRPPLPPGSAPPRGGGGVDRRAEDRRLADHGDDRRDAPARPP